MDVLSVLVILFSLALIMYLALKAISILLIAPLTEYRRNILNSIAISRNLTRYLYGRIY